MKHISTSLLLFALLISANSIAQTEKESASNNPSLGLNLVKVNLTAIPLGNFSFQYERAISKKISAGIGLRIMPKSKLPLSSLIKDVINDDEAWRHFESLKISNFAVTPEVRFYMGKSAFRGFYIAPFARIAGYTVQMPFEFEYEHPQDGTIEETIPLEGRISTFTGGFMLGAQWKLSKLIYLDWWILGPHYGTSNGHITGTKSLTSDEQAGLRDALSDLDEVSFVDKYEVNSTGARVDIKGPWGGVRAGLALGFRF